MFDIMIESHAGHPRPGRRTAVPAAVLLHALAVGAILAYSLLVFRQVSDPRDLLQPVILDPRFGPGVEPLEGDGGASSKTPIARPAPRAIPREAVQPAQVFPLPPTTPAVEAVEDAPGGYDGLGI